jgi:hypothetical protein
MDPLVAVSNSLRSNVLYIRRRREIGGKTSVSVNANVIGWSVMCPWSMIGAIAVSGHGVSSSSVPYFVKCTYVFFSSTANRVEALRQLLSNMATWKEKHVAYPSVVIA